MLSIDSGEGAGLSALTTHAFARTFSALTSELHATGYAVRTVQSGDALLGEHMPSPDIILVDLDAKGRSDDGSGMTVSGHRLVTLLARQLTRHTTALVVMTDLDFAEVEELARVGVHAFLSPRQPVHVCLDDIRAAVKRQHARRRGTRRVACHVVPVLTPLDRDAAVAVVHAPVSLAVAHA
jgi:DNA-binding NarL/FixJ family response regulator